MDNSTIIVSRTQPKRKPNILKKLQAKKAHVTLDALKNCKTQPAKHKKVASPCTKPSIVKLVKASEILGLEFASSVTNEEVIVPDLNYDVQKSILSDKNESLDDKKTGMHSRKQNLSQRDFDAMSDVEKSTSSHENKRFNNKKTKTQSRKQKLSQRPIDVISESVSSHKNKSPNNKKTVMQSRKQNISQRNFDVISDEEVTVVNLSDSDNDNDVVITEIVMKNKEDSTKSNTINGEETGDENREESAEEIRGETAEEDSDDEDTEDCYPYMVGKARAEDINSFILICCSQCETERKLTTKENRARCARCNDPMFFKCTVCTNHVRFNSLTMMYSHFNHAHYELIVSIANDKNTEKSDTNKVSNLESHILSSKSNNTEDIDPKTKKSKLWKCKICNKCYQYRSHLTRHKKMCKPTYYWCCLFCTKKVNFKAELKSHMIICHIKRFRCVEDVDIVVDSIVKNQYSDTDT